MLLVFRLVQWIPVDLLLPALLLIRETKMAKQVALAKNFWVMLGYVGFLGAHSASASLRALMHFDAGKP